MPDPLPPNHNASIAVLDQKWAETRDAIRLSGPLAIHSLVSKLTNDPTPISFSPEEWSLTASLALLSIHEIMVRAKESTDAH